MKELTKKEHEKRGDYVWSFSNGDYKWEKDRIQHLVRNGKEIYKGSFVWSFDNGDYKWIEKNGTEHLIREGKEICKGGFVWSFGNGEYEWEKDGVKHFVKNKKVANNKTLKN